MGEKELLDVFDDNFVRIGSAPRDEVHRTGQWHQSFHCWLIRHVGSHRYILFQKRGPQKSIYPNALDITAAGHLTAGETPQQGIRELNEELGLNAVFEDLVPLGIRCDVAKIGSVTNREFCHVYLLESNRPLEEYKLQHDEVTGLVQMHLHDCFRLFTGEVESVIVEGIELAENARRQVSISISQADVIPRLDAYYLKIAIMAERYFTGSRYVAI